MHKAVCTSAEVTGDWQDEDGARSCICFAKLTELFTFCGHRLNMSSLLFLCVQFSTVPAPLTRITIQQHTSDSVFGAINKENCGCHTDCIFFEFRLLTHFLFLFHRWARFSTEKNIYQMDKCTVLQGNVKDRLSRTFPNSSNCMNVIPFQILHIHIWMFLLLHGCLLNLFSS